MIPPENAWLRRSNNDIIIGCYSSQQTWQLKCDGREWKGLVGTCPELCEFVVLAKDVKKRTAFVLHLFIQLLDQLINQFIVICCVVFSTDVGTIGPAEKHAVNDSLPGIA